MNAEEQSFKKSYILFLKWTTFWGGVYIVAYLWLTSVIMICECCAVSFVAIQIVPRVIFMSCSSSWTLYGTFQRVLDKLSFFFFNSVPEQSAGTLNTVFLSSGKISCVMPLIICFHLYMDFLVWSPSFLNF